MGKKEEVEHTTETTKTTETETQTPVLPTTQEELDALKSAAIEQGRLEAEDKYKGIQRTVNKKDDEIEQLRKKLAQPPSKSKASKIILEDMEAKQTETGEVNPRIALLKAELAEEEKKEAQEAQLQYQEKIIGENREKFNKLIEEKGVDPNDERLDDFHDAFEDAMDTGRFERAERKLSRILSKVEPKKDEPQKESEEDQKAKWIEEGKRLKMEEAGLLKTDNNMPSGVGMTKAQAMEKFNKGEISSDEVEKRFPDAFR